MDQKDKDRIDKLMRSIHDPIIIKQKGEGAMSNIIIIFAILRRMGMPDKDLHSIFVQSVTFRPYVDMSDVKLLRALIEDANDARTKESVNKAFLKLMEIVLEVDKKPVK